MVMNDSVYLGMTRKSIKFETESYECFVKTILATSLFGSDILCVVPACILFYLSII